MLKSFIMFEKISIFVPEDKKPEGTTEPPKPNPSTK